MDGKDLAYWLADKIPAYGDYAKQAADVLRKQADEIERLRADAARLDSHEQTQRGNTMSSITSLNNITLDK